MTNRVKTVREPYPVASASMGATRSSNPGTSHGLPACKELLHVDDGKQWGPPTPSPSWAHHAATAAFSAALALANCPVARTSTV